MQKIDKLYSLRQSYDKMTYKQHQYSVSQSTLKVKFEFSIDDVFVFQPETVFELKNNITDTSFLDYLIFHLGMAEFVSYWKVCCPQKVEILPYKLNEQQILWWKKLYFYGLGEFFYLNNIHLNFDEFMKIDASKGKEGKIAHYSHSHEAVILPVGGGKDSIVSLEFYKSLGKNIFPMLVNPRPAMTESITVSGVSDEYVIKINRTIDPLLLELNAQGFLNGHTPFSSVLAFQSLICSFLTGIKDIALSNESSANEPTVLGTSVNHQYSKSYLFENDFREYTQQFLIPELNYFSVLRPFSELQIAFIFSSFPQYFSTFRSCNSGSKQNFWCCNCSKCLFTAIILHPFLDSKQLEQIFGVNIFNKRALLKVFNQLIGIENTKPFECVGTTDEINIALQFAISKHYSHTELPFLLSYYYGTSLFKPIDTELINDIIFKHFDSKHFLNSVLYEQLVAFLKRTDKEHKRI